jgi:putative peptidoglycan lipid II flippase
MRERRSIIKNTVKMGIGTALSRAFGLVRDILLARFLGAGATADAFNIAYNMPNTLRKIFAEGALNNAVSPTVVTILKKDSVQKVNELITIVFISIQAFLLLMCTAMSFGARQIIFLQAPGFAESTQCCAAQLASIMIFFIMFLSGLSLLTGALVAMQKFFMPSYGQAIMNILFIIELAGCIYFNLSLNTCAFLILLNGLLVFLAHLIAYRKAGLSWAWPTRETRENFIAVMKKFLPCILTVGSAEVAFFIDKMMASYLPAGSISLFQYASNFLRVPIGIFAVAFATILLPSMSHLALKGRARLSFFLFEALKLMAWVTIPASLLMFAFSHKIFSTFYLSAKFPMESVIIAGNILATFSIVLFFFSINKILVNVFNSMHNTVQPTIITLGCTAFNTALNAILMRSYGILGITIATSLATVLQTIILLTVLSKKHRVVVYFKQFGMFLLKTFAHVIFFGILLYLTYHMAVWAIHQLPSTWSYLLLEKQLYWLWVGPLCLFYGLLMYMTRKKFGIRVYFLD